MKIKIEKEIIATEIVEMNLLEILNEKDHFKENDLTSHQDKGITINITFATDHKIIHLIKDGDYGFVWFKTNSKISNELIVEIVDKIIEENK